MYPGFRPGQTPGEMLETGYIAGQAQMHLPERPDKIIGLNAIAQI